MDNPYCSCKLRRDYLFQAKMTPAEAFVVIDLDRDGFVSRHDFIAACTGQVFAKLRRPNPQHAAQ